MLNEEKIRLMTKAASFEAGEGKKALEMNRPNGMMLLVDADNTPAICLYASMGFAKVQGQNNLTAHWTVPSAE